MFSGPSSLGAFQLQLLHNVNRASRALARNELVLSTGKRINSAADDPSGSVFVGRRRAELASVQQLLQNAEKANALLSTADSSLGTIIEHIQTIRTKTLEAASGGLSQDELQANQDAIDQALTAIDAAATSTEFAGKRLLDGSQGSSITGLNTTQVKRLTVLKSSQHETQTIDVNVTAEAEQATLSYKGSGNGRVKDDATFTLTGDLGSITVNVDEDDKLSKVRDQINQSSQSTGVTATVSGKDLIFTSNKSGSSADISIDVQSGKFNVTGGNGDGTANGTDATAIINGQSVVGSGDTFMFRSSNLDFDLELNSSFGLGKIDTITHSSQSITFQLGTQPGNTAQLSLTDMRTTQLGGSYGVLSELSSNGGKSLLDGEASTALEIADDALSQALAAQSKVGSFSSITIDSFISILKAQESGITRAISIVEDADLAEELALKVKNQLQAESASAALLSASTNFFPVQNIFELIKG